MATKPKPKAKPKKAPAPKAGRPRSEAAVEFKGLLDEITEDLRAKAPKATEETTGKFEYLPCTECNTPGAVYAAYLVEAGPVALCSIECEEKWMKVRQHKQAK